MDWKIFYGDGSSYSSDDGTPERAPSYNVQAIVFADKKVGRLILRGGDFYIHREDGWVSVDNFGMLDQMMHVFKMLDRKSGKWWVQRDGEWKEVDCLSLYLELIEMGFVKTGRNIPREQFEAIQQNAMNDPDFPRKSAKLPYGSPYEAPKQFEPRTV